MFTTRSKFDKNIVLSYTCQRNWEAFDSNKELSAVNANPAMLVGPELVSLNIYIIE